MTTFENVPAEDLEELIEEMFKVLEKIVKEDGIDMECIKIVISRDWLKVINYSWELRIKNKVRNCLLIIDFICRH